MKSLFKINFLTYIFLIISMLSGYMREVFLIFIILVIHEFGHFILMRLNKIDVLSITIYPYGGMINSNILLNTNSFKVLLISLGGVFIQLLLWLIFFLLYELNLIDFIVYDLFFKYNISIIVFNLIPIYPLDGFKILNSLLELCFNFKKSVFISLCISFILLIFFIYYLYVFRISNYVIILFLIYSFISYIRELKYLFNKFYIERFLYNIDYRGIISITDINKIYKNKYNYINGVGEKDYFKNAYNLNF